MFYNNFENDIEPDLYFKGDDYEMQSISFKDQFVIKETEYNSNSFSLNSNDFRDLYYVDRSPQMELKEEGQFPKETEKEKKLGNDINLIERTRTTAFKTILPVIHKEKEKEIIFEIKKEKIRKPLLGRKRKNQLPHTNPRNDNDDDNDNVHTKHKKDDMFTKLKRNSYNNSLDSVNYTLKHSPNKKLNSIKLKKIDNSVLIVSKKEENQKLFKTQLKDLFSNKISKKYKDKYHKSDYNAKMIKYIIQQNDQKVNYTLNKSFGDMIEIYVDKNKEKIDGFVKLKDDKKLLKKNNDKEYIRLFTEFGYNFEENIEKIYPRRKRKKQSGENHLTN